MAETYAAYVKQPIHLLTLTISAAMNLYCKAYDVGNVFAEVLASVDSFFMIPDAQFQKWWEEELKQPPIPDRHVIPILKALQGYLESPWLWDKHFPRCLLMN